MRAVKMIFIAVCMLVISGCSHKTEYDEASKLVYAMDTEMSLKAYGDNAKEVIEQAESEIKRLDNLFRRGSSNSEIYKLNSESSLEASDDTADLINKAQYISTSTNGAFDISIAPIMDLWGFYSKQFYVPDEDDLRQALLPVNYKHIQTNENFVTLENGAQIDPGGIAKGYTSDRIAEIFKSCGVESGIVSLGGNVHSIGKKPDGSKWRVAIQNPDNNEYICTVEVSDKAVITSGGYQRFFEQDGNIYHHIINPQTGYPAESGLKSVSVISDDGALADGLSTALFVMGLDEGINYWKEHDGFDVIFMTDDNAIYITDGIAGSVESQHEYTVINK